MRKRETRPRRARKHDESTAFYTNARGMESRIVSFRMYELVYQSLFSYAQSVGMDPSACIREAVAMYLREKARAAGPPVGDRVGSPVGRDAGDRSGDLSSWLARSSKL